MGAVEYEAAAAGSGAGAGGANRVEPSAADARDAERALEWVLLAQFQCDPAEGLLPAAEPPPGGGRRGVLTWLIRREDLALGHFAEAALLRQF
ncbi:hypothetical protein [Streptomyces sp. NPDC007369]|uniref:hypothetical protein n=1 Tax=Streptomyces sp. NPDC007369 TaxID=3154589 RepID=UPI003400262D